MSFDLRLLHDGRVVSENLAMAYRPCSTLNNFSWAVHITELLLHVYSDRWVGIYTFGGGLFPPDGYIRPVVTTSRTDLLFYICLISIKILDFPCNMCDFERNEIYNLNWTMAGLLKN
jgi:hypothetical protein